MDIPKMEKGNKRDDKGDPFDFIDLCSFNPHFHIGADKARLCSAVERLFFQIHLILGFL